MKFTPGIGVGALSGSLGGTTASHNKGGAYFRVRAIPTNPDTDAQLAQRARMATTSQQWAALTMAQRQSWESWAQQNPRIDALGSSFQLSGAQAYNALNTRILLDAGTVIDVPPIVSAPPAFLTFVQTGDIGAGAFTAAFTAALVSGNKVELTAALVNSAGIKNVNNKYRHIGFSGVDEASPWDNEADIAAVLGTLTVGQTLHAKIAQYDPATGLRSPFLHSDVVIETTV